MKSDFVLLELSIFYLQLETIKRNVYTFECRFETFSINDIEFITDPDWSMLLQLV